MVQVEYRICKGCRKKKSLDEFAWGQGRNSDGSKRKYRLGKCRPCLNKQIQERNRRNPDKRRIANAAWRAKNPEKRRVSQTRYNQTEKARENRKRYARTTKGKKTTRKYRRRAQLRLVANIPTPVMKPYVEHLITWYDSGLNGLSMACGVDEAVLRRIIKGQSKSVDLGTADRIALQGDFSLDELSDRAREWALLTGDKWPDGYKGRVAPYRSDR